MNDWTVITVTYNSAEHLKRCWSADERPYRWIVVDNNSSDSSVEVASSLGADVLQLGRNAGFSAANNAGLELATSKFTLFANPDVVVEPIGLRALGELAQSQRALVSPQLLNPDGSEQPNARGLPFLADKFANRSVRAPGSRLEDYVRTELSGPTYVAWVMGATVAGLTEDIRRIGAWNESFFLYYEDHEIGLRAWKHGVPVIVDPGVRWVHGWQRETAQMNFGAWKREVPSALRFYGRHPGLLLRWPKVGTRRYQSIQHRLWTPVAAEGLSRSH